MQQDFAGDKSLNTDSGKFRLGTTRQGTITPWCHLNMDGGGGAIDGWAFLDPLDFHGHGHLSVWENWPHNILSSL